MTQTINSAGLPKQMVSLPHPVEQFARLMKAFPYLSKALAVPNDVQRLAFYAMESMNLVHWSLEDLEGRIENFYSAPRFCGAPLRNYLKRGDLADPLRKEIQSYLEGKKEAFPRMENQLKMVLHDAKTDAELFDATLDCVEEFNQRLKTLSEAVDALKRACPIFTEAFKQWDDLEDPTDRGAVFSICDLMHSGLDHLDTIAKASQEVKKIRNELEELEAAIEKGDPWVSKPRQKRVDLSRLKARIKSLQENPSTKHYTVPPPSDRVCDALFEGMVRRQEGSSPLLAMLDIPERRPKIRPGCEWLDLAVADDLLAVRSDQFQRASKPTLIEKIAHVSKNFFSRLKAEVRGTMERISNRDVDEHPELIFGDS